MLTLGWHQADRARFRRLKLEYDVLVPLSNFAINLNLRHYSQVIRSLISGSATTPAVAATLQGAAHAEAAAAAPGPDARLVGVTRELCAAKLTERSLLASLAATRRRADGAASHAAVGPGRHCSPRHRMLFYLRTRVQNASRPHGGQWAWQIVLATS
jgi:hypothetical protein